MAQEEALAALVASVDEHDCSMIADALDAIDPDDQQDTERAVSLADAFRRASALHPAPHDR